MKVYLDSSAIVKRYVEERGSTIVRKVYREAYSGSATLTVSAWNIGEVLGVFNKYRRRGWLSEEGYTEALRTFASETSRLIKLGVMS
ncbi:MAG: type II toxin-antitoxin system VapC family toxin, partial [Thermofilaceae archaeon]